MFLPPSKYTDAEFEKMNVELNRLRDLTQDQLRDIDRLTSEKHADHAGHTEELARLQDQVRKLEADLRRENTRRLKLTKERQEKNAQLSRAFEEHNLKTQQELEQYKELYQQTKMKLDVRLGKQPDPTIVLGSAEQKLADNIAKLEKDVKKKDSDLKVERTKVETMKKGKADADAAAKAAVGERDKFKADASKMRSERDTLAAQNRDLKSKLDDVRDQLGVARDEFTRLAAEGKDSTAPMSYASMTRKIKDLEADIAILSGQKK